MSTVPDESEVAAGTVHEALQGRIWEFLTDEDLRAGLEKAFDYRGDVTIQLKDGSSVDGYIFDRQTGSTLAESSVRLFPNGEARKMTISYSDIAGVVFSGRDTAAGKSWDAWVTKYLAKRAAGEKNIAIGPEPLD